MRRKRNIRLVLTIFTVFALALFLPRLSIAGSLEPPASAVRESGYPLPTMTTPPSWSQQLPASERFQPVLFVKFCLPNPLGGPPFCTLMETGILDKETGLVWEQSPNYSDTLHWYSAKSYCYDLNKGGRKGWRLPTTEELTSLVDLTQSNPALPSGHPFNNVYVADYYWSATTWDDIPDYAWLVHMGNGNLAFDHKLDYVHHVWCVRGGQGVDGQSLR